MKKNYIISLLFCFIAVTVFSAKPINAKQLTKERISGMKSQHVDAPISAETPNVLLVENFSKFTAGSEATPDATDITDAETGEIPVSFTQVAGWSGWGVYQAGSTAYLGWVKYSEYNAEYQDGPGYIATPVFDASTASTGYTIKFKARSKSAVGDSLAVYWNWYDEELEDYNYDGVEGIFITNQWAEYTVESTFGNAESFVDIYATASEFYIDDVEISVSDGGTTPPAGNVVFYETFGEAGGKKDIAEYTDYDNSAPVSFSITTTDSPDVRTTSTMDAHVWFPANKETDLVINNIQAKSYSNLKLSFDVASAATSTDLNKVIVLVNDVAVTVPSVAITAPNKYVSSGDIAINPADVIKLRFYYTVANNPTNYGYRLDNVKITGTNISGFDTPQISGIYISNRQLVLGENTSNEIEIYSISGVLTAKFPVQTQTISLDLFQKGVYLVKSGNKIQKFIF